MAQMKRQEMTGRSTHISIKADECVVRVCVCEQSGCMKERQNKGKIIQCIIFLSGGGGEEGDVR